MGQFIPKFEILCTLICMYRAHIFVKKRYTVKHKNKRTNERPPQNTRYTNMTCHHCHSLRIRVIFSYQIQFRDFIVEIYEITRRNYNILNSRNLKNLDTCQYFFHTLYIRLSNLVERLLAWVINIRNLCYIKPPANESQN